MVEGGEKAVIAIAEAVKTILKSVGEDVEREGLLDTPARVAKMYMEMFSGLRDTAPKMTTFERGDNDQMITMFDLDYWSMCEHHLVPFFGHVHIGYVPGDMIAGLSKFARVMEFFAKRPQIQERMTAQIAGHIIETIKPKGVIVVVEGTHLCMSMRGVKKPNHTTTTSAIRGEIHKQEFFDLMKARRHR